MTVGEKYTGRAIPLSPRYPESITLQWSKQAGRALSIQQNKQNKTYPYPVKDRHKTGNGQWQGAASADAALPSALPAACDLQQSSPAAAGHCQGGQPLPPGSTLPRRRLPRAQTTLSTIRTIVRVSFGMTMLSPNMMNTNRFPNSILKQRAGAEQTPSVATAETSTSHRRSPL